MLTNLHALDGAGPARATLREGPTTLRLAPRRLPLLLRRAQPPAAHSDARGVLLRKPAE